MLTMTTSPSIRASQAFTTPGTTSTRARAEGVFPLVPRASVRSSSSPRTPPGHGPATTAAQSHAPFTKDKPLPARPPLGRSTTSPSSVSQVKRNSQLSNPSSPPSRSTSVHRRPKSAGPHSPAQGLSKSTPSTPSTAAQQLSLEIEIMPLPGTKTSHYSPLHSSVSTFSSTPSSPSLSIRGRDGPRTHSSTLASLRSGSSRSSASPRQGHGHARAPSSSTTSSVAERLSVPTEGWYLECGRRGERQPYQPHEWTEVPYWLSYAQGSLDYDALLTASLFATSNGSAAYLPPTPRLGELSQPGATPPQRVLDIGSGAVGQWAITQATMPGWEQTEFVLLDIAPSEVPYDLLPTSVAERITYYQANFLDRLPFDDDQFDFVRMAQIAMGVPETGLADLLEEANRVLIPGALFEVIEQDFTVLRPSKAITGDDHGQDVFDVAEEAVDAVLKRRFINTRSLALLPSALALEMKGVRSSGILSVEMPANPPPRLSPASSATSLSDPDSRPHTPEPELRTSPLMSHSAGTMADSDAFFSSPEAGRVLLAATADRMAGSSYGLAHDAATRRIRKAKMADPTVQIKHDRLVAELSGAIHDYADDLRQRAGIDALLGSQFGWECSFDLQTERSLEDNLPLFDERLAEYDDVYANAATAEDVDPQVEFRRAQVLFAKREAEAELKAVRARLGEREFCGGGGGNSLGALESAMFVARAA